MDQGSVFYYDPSIGFLRTVLSCKHTIVPITLRRFEFWIFFFCHLGVVWAYRSGYLPDADNPDSNLNIDWNDMKVISAITIFFQVFHTNHVYSRYLHMYNVTRQMLGTFLDICSEIRLHCRQGGLLQHARLSTRYLIASTLLFFYEMNGTVSEREWAVLIAKGFVRREEQYYLKGFDKHKRSIIMLQWSAEVYYCGLIITKTNTNVLNAFMRKLHKVRSLQQEVLDTMGLPVPFQYFHLLHMMIAVNLTLWAYCMGITQSLFAPVVYFFAEMIFVGMLELACELADPFGKDAVDFPVNEWLSDFIETSVVFLEQEYAGSKDNWSAVLAKEEKLQPADCNVNIFLDSETPASSPQESRKANYAALIQTTPHNSQCQL